MATRMAIRNRETQETRSHAVNRHTRQGLAGLRDRVGAKEESWPYWVSAATGIVGIAAASMVGAAELAVGVAAAYVAYDVIARGVPIWSAIKQAEDEVRV